MNKLLRRRGFPLMALLFPVMSAFGAEQDELASTLKLLEQVTASVERARVLSVQDEPHARYFFDYTRLQSDLQTIRAGIELYLIPTRAQPRETTLLGIGGNYRQEHPRCQ